MPLTQLPDVVRRTQSNAVALSGSNDMVKTDIDAELKTLQRQCKVPICIGGNYAIAQQISLESLGLYPLGSDRGSGFSALKQLLSAFIVSVTTSGDRNEQR